jgi:hypothetical protein
LPSPAATAHDTAEMKKRARKIPIIRHLVHPLHAEI